MERLESHREWEQKINLGVPSYEATQVQNSLLCGHRHLCGLNPWPSFQKLLGKLHEPVILETDSQELTDSIPLCLLCLPFHGQLNLLLETPFSPASFYKGLGHGLIKFLGQFWLQILPDLQKLGSWRVLKVPWGHFGAFLLRFFF